MSEKSEIERFADQMADEYSQSIKDGRRYISRSWAHLSPHTRVWLTKNEAYEPNGNRASSKDPADGDRIEDLEHALGVLEAAAKASIPARDAPQGTEIPKAACAEEVIRAIEAVLFAPQSRDPMFLRLALHALRHFELATLLMRLPTKAKVSGGFVAKVIARGLVTGILLLLAPAGLAYALVAVARGDTAVAAVGFYLVAFAVLAWGSKKDAPLEPDERAWLTWQRIGYVITDGSWTAYGAGATELLRDLLRQGAAVRPLAFDLCAALTAATLGPARHSIEANTNVQSI